MGQIEQLYFCEKKKSSSSQDILYRMLGMRTPSVAGLTGVRKSPMCLRRKTATEILSKLHRLYNSSSSRQSVSYSYEFKKLLDETKALFVGFSERVEKG